MATMANNIDSGDINYDYNPFDRPIKKVIQDRLDKEEEDFHRQVAPPREPEEEAVLKSVYCNYRGRLTVYDIHGKKVHELSGMITYEKYTEIERRSSPEITEFDGINDYRRIAAELKRNTVDGKDGVDYSGFDHTHDDPLSGLGVGVMPLN